MIFISLTLLEGFITPTALILFVDLFPTVNICLNIGKDDEGGAIVETFNNCLVGDLSLVRGTISTYKVG